MGGSDIKSIFDQLTKETEAAATKLKELGIPAFDKEGNFRGIRAILRDINEVEQGSDKPMMIGGSRVCGKTTELIKKSSSDQLYIVCADRQRLKVITQMAKSMELEIPFPIIAEELPLRSPFIKKVLVDDVESVLYRLIQKPILMASTSMEFKPLQIKEEKE